jgi:hypothetical protein
MKYAIGRFGFFGGSVWSLILLAASVAFAQSTEFAFQGKLPNSITPSTDIYEIEFKLFDAATDGNQIGTTVNVSGVEVKNRGFIVKLDFGAAAFTGADRFLEVSVRLQNTDGPFTVISPREKILSVPYAIRALDATNVGIDPSDLVLTNDPRLSDARNPLPDSPFYIQNTTSQQTGAHFNISGNGTAGGTLSANTINASTQYNIGGDRVLTAPANNVFVGKEAGAVNTGSNNTFVGFRAGLSNTLISGNSFFGSEAGRNNNIGSSNSFFGHRSGFMNTAGFQNSFFGTQAGSNNTGNHNAFFGTFSGPNNTTGVENSFFGFDSGFSNTQGLHNSFFGSSAGRSNTTGNFNSFFGHNAGRLNTVGVLNSFFGRSAGSANTEGSGNSFFGDVSGSNNTLGNGNSFFGEHAGLNNSTGSSNSAVVISAGSANTTGSSNTFIGANANSTGILDHATAIGANSTVNSWNTIALGRSNGSDRVLIYGLLQVDTLGAGGAVTLCRNASNQVATCASSLRYKTGVQPFLGGLQTVRRLRPISFNWRDGGVRDIGFGAEAVEKVEPLLVTRTANGQVEGVKYAQITTVLVNAIQQQQAQIEAQHKQIQRQSFVIEALRRLLCQKNPHADVCK